jgi:hypothetical protein
MPIVAKRQQLARRVTKLPRLVVEYYFVGRIESHVTSLAERSRSCTERARA